MKNKKLLIITGEKSGLNAILPSLTATKKRLLKNIRLVAPDYSQVPDEIRSNIFIPSHTGLTISSSLLIDYIRIFSEIIKYVRTNSFTDILLVDNPDFNLILASILYQQGCRLYYYIIPQVWAWREYRVKYLRKFFKKIFVIFPFEKEFLKKYGIESEFVGHPAYEECRNKRDTLNMRKTFGLNRNERIISLFPGTRESVLSRHFSIFEDAARLIAEKMKNFRVIISDIRREHNHTKGKIIYSPVNAINLLNISDFAVISSGSTTMEAAFLKKPFIGVYKPDILTYSAGKVLIKTESTVMPNILLNERFIPEIISPYLSKDEIVNTVINVAGDRLRLNIIRKKLSVVSSMFEGYRTSEIIRREIESVLK
ncbi:MAG: hypothetical protein N3B13_02820 [Deltaproteobacteria bacterium]|nr:hypothetical protein [Deltaproteobacteria bacterium]